MKKEGKSNQHHLNTPFFSKFKSSTTISPDTPDHLSSIIPKIISCQPINNSKHMFRFGFFIFPNLLGLMMPVCYLLSIPHLVPLLHEYHWLKNNKCIIVLLSLKLFVLLLPLMFKAQSVELT